MGGVVDLTSFSFSFSSGLASSSSSGLDRFWESHEEKLLDLEVTEAGGLTGLSTGSA